MTFQLWNPDWFPLPGQAVFDREKQRITVVSRTPTNLDLFVIGNDDRVWSTFWPVQGLELERRLVSTSRAGQVRPLSKSLAVARAPHNLDLFVIGNDGHV